MRPVVSLDQHKAAVRRGRPQAADEEHGFSGSFAVTLLPDLLQMYALARSTGRLRVFHSGEEAEVWFAAGDIVHCELEGLAGEEALFELLSWPGGSYELEVGAVAPRRSIESSWEEVLIEGCRRLDESGRLPTTSLSPALIPGTPTLLRREEMSPLRESLKTIAQVDGFLGVCVVDTKSGKMLAFESGGSKIQLEVAAAGNSEVVKAKRRTMEALGLDDDIEDILITLVHQYHLIRPLQKKDGLFLYLVIERAHSNLALARLRLAELERQIDL